MPASRWWGAPDWGMPFRIGTKSAQKYTQIQRVNSHIVCCVGLLTGTLQDRPDSAGEEEKSLPEWRQSRGSIQTETRFLSTVASAESRKILADPPEF